MNDDARFGWQFDREPKTSAWADWPLCPRCRAPRRTACPTCKVPGTDFALAELNPAAEFLPALDSTPHHPEHQRRHGGDGCGGDGCGGDGCGGDGCGGAGALTVCARHDEAIGADDDDRGAELPPDDPSAVAGDGPEVMLLCPTCDEAFSPRFYRRCANCGYDFGSGREAGPVEEPVTNYRVVLAVVAVIAALAGLWMYLAWLFRE